MVCGNATVSTTVTTRVVSIGCSVRVYGGCKIVGSAPERTKGLYVDVGCHGCGVIEEMMESAEDTMLESFMVA